MLERAPTPADGARLTITAISAALKRAGRQRCLAQRAEQIQAALRTEQLSAPDLAVAAFAATTHAQVGMAAMA